MSRLTNAGIAVGVRATGALLALAIVLASGTAEAAPTARLPLRIVADIPLGGSPSRFDTVSLDTARDRLYVAHLGDGVILAVDLRRRVVVARIPAPGVHGVLAVPGLGRIFGTATGDHQLVTVDEQTDSVIARTPAGTYPDGIAYDAGTGQLFVSDELGGVEAIVDARSGHRVGTVKLGGQAGNVQYDPVSRQILVAVQTRNELAVIDPELRRVVRRKSLPGCVHDHGLLLDPAHRLAFVACDGNSRLLVLDLRTLAVRDTQTVGPLPDVLAFDPQLRRLYVAAESGIVTVFAESGGSLRKLGEGFLAQGAHSVAVDPGTHLAYFPLAHQGGPPVLRIMKPGTPSAGGSAGNERAYVALPKLTAPGPWQLLGEGQASGRSPTSQAHGRVANPNRMAFAIAASPPQPVSVLWTVLCNDNVGDRERTTSGTFSARAPLVRYPKLPLKFPNGPCTLYVTAHPSGSGTTRIGVYAY
jgi:DNA-binding beta-propeller fold protein YncE